MFRLLRHLVTSRVRQVVSLIQYKTVLIFIVGGLVHILCHAHSPCCKNLIFQVTDQFRRRNQPRSQGQEEGGPW